MGAIEAVIGRWEPLEGGSHWKVEALLVIVRKSTGPDFDQMFEVPKIIQKVSQKVQGP